MTISKIIEKVTILDDTFYIVRDYDLNPDTELSVFKSLNLAVQNCLDNNWLWEIIMEDENVE